MKDFLSIGEMLIDLTPAGDGSADYRPNPGGAPANVACVMAKLGHSASFVGKVGGDFFGTLCARTLADCRVDTDYLFIDKNHPTTLAVVSLDETGNRDFGFYRENTADVNLSVEDILHVPFEEYKIFHFGSLSLTAQISHDSLHFALDKAKRAGCIISYDPNLRMGLWDNAENAKRNLLKMFPYADIIKISEEEGEFLFGETDEEKLLALIHEKFGTPLIIITKAEKGSIGRIGGKHHNAAAFKVNAIDTTGAGDAFLGGLLHCMLECNADPRQGIGEEELLRMLTFGNATGSIVTQKKGAIPAIPTLSEVEEYIRRDERIVF